MHMEKRSVCTYVVYKSVFRRFIFWGKRTWFVETMMLLQVKNPAAWKIKPGDIRADISVDIIVKDACRMKYSYSDISSC